MEPDEPRGRLRRERHRVRGPGSAADGGPGPTTLSAASWPWRSSATSPRATSACRRSSSSGGPKRAGKGKLLDVLTALVGEAQVEASGLSEMSRPFGIENWIEKGLAILDDARDEHVDVGLLSRRMLSISGAAMTAVERKGIKNWSGRLATRIVITSNLLIELRDPAGVLASRMEVLPFSKSFYGEEDLTLGARLENQMSSDPQPRPRGLRPTGRGTGRAVHPSGVGSSGP
ncbi:DUF5906 domain-containing protein [Gordonia humi]|uniref:DUF5906 domain-containing protein n=1 Tax=Gordonia humi TaxID=686429 RepID=UPI00360F97C6